VTDVESLQPYFEPLRKSVRVARPVAEAFALFTQHMGTWWPLASHSICAERAAGCGIEPRVGGMVYEERDDGERFEWGRVLAWEPPHRVVVTWYPGREPDTSQEVEFRFVPDAGGTRLELEHRGWSQFGPGAREARQGYSSGWDFVLQHYVDREPGDASGGRS